MNINTEKEAEEYFHHNPEEKKVYFLMINEDEKELLDNSYAIIDIESNLLAIEENK